MKIPATQIRTQPVENQRILLKYKKNRTGEIKWMNLINELKNKIKK